MIKPVRDGARRARRFGPAAGPAILPAVLSVLLWAGGSAEGSAQRRYATIDSLRHIQSVEPRAGPPGTTVAVYTENLPPQARIHVGVGAMRAGFEALAEGTQEIWGEVSATVRIPEYATWERPVVFIIFNGVFSPIAVSNPFHVTDEEGMVRRRGRVTDEGLQCTTLRDADQYVYGLIGDLGRLRPGDEIVVEGEVNPGGACGGTDAIRVVRWTRETPGPGSRAPRAPRDAAPSRPSVGRASPPGPFASLHRAGSSRRIGVSAPSRDSIARYRNPSGP